LAKGSTHAASLPAPAFRELLLAHPEVALNLLCRLAEVVRRSDDRIMNLSTLGANNRIYSELLRAVRHADPAAFEQGQGQATVKPPPSHAEIAGRVNAARETVTRVLGDLAKKGILKRQHGALVVLDIARLKRMVDEFRSE
jgi:CRP-like cAMP-binding protein